MGGSLVAVLLVAVLGSWRIGERAAWDDTVRSSVRLVHRRIVRKPNVPERVSLQKCSHLRELTMPWTANDAERHTHKATTSELKELWARVANERLEKTGDEGRAIREANAVVSRQSE